MGPVVLIAGVRPLAKVLAAGAARCGFVGHWFDGPSSRDPTLELPAAAIRGGATCVVLVHPEREEPDTIEVLRERGIRVIAWALPFHRGVSRNMLSRQRWIVRAADVVAVTVPRRSELFHDRRGRPAFLVHAPRDTKDDAAIDAALAALLDLLDR